MNSPFLLHDRVESLPSWAMCYLQRIKWLTRTQPETSLAVPSADKGLLTRAYGSFPIQFVRLVTSYFPNPRKSPMVLKQPAGTKDLAPQSNTLIPPQ